MPQFQHKLTGLLLLVGLLAACGTPSLPSTNQARSTSSTARPTTAAVSQTAAVLPTAVTVQTADQAAYPLPTSLTPAIPYPPPSSTLQHQSTNQPLQPATSAVLFAAPVLGVVTDREMRVLSIDIASAAAAAGIQVGDRLETLDGIPVDTQLEQVKQHIRMARQDQAMQLVVRRGSNSIEVSVVPLSSQARSGPTVETGQVVPTATAVVAPDEYL